MARGSAALARANKVAAAAKKRAANLRKKIESVQPVEIAATVAGGGAGGMLDAKTPAFMLSWGLDYPSAAIGVLGVSYGIFSARSGQTEKLITCLGTGMLSGVAYDFSKNKALEA